VLDSARFGRTPVQFLLVLAACCLVAIVALVIVVAQRGPAPGLVGLCLAVLPIPLLVVLILYLDRLEPEPRALLAAMFGAGAGMAVITALLGRALHTGAITPPELGPHAGRVVAITVGAAIGGALVAETLSGAVLLALLASRRTEIDGAHDGVVYASMTGLGFALVANLYAYSQAWNAGASALVEEFTRRGIFGPLFQALFTSMIGLGIAYAASRRSGGYLAIIAGWIAAVALDALWNHSVAAGGTSLLVTYVILIAALIGVIVVVVIDRQRVVAMITMFLPGFEDPEVVMVTDVRMLASLRMRRLGRQWARLNLGLDGKRAMAQYQLAATELAMACNRNSFGRTTTEAYAKHRDDSLDLMRAAAAIVRRQEQLYPPPWLGPDDLSVFVARAVGPPRPMTWPRPPVGLGRALPERGLRFGGGRRAALAGASADAERCPLESQQPLLAIEAAAVAGQRPVGADHAVTGHDDRDRIAAVGETHGARGERRLAERGGHLAVAGRHAVGDLGELRPDGELERGTAGRQRQVKHGPRAREILRELVRRGPERTWPSRPLRGRRHRVPPGVHHEQPAEGLLVPGQQQSAHR
jgi:protease PrsW